MLSLEPLFPRFHRHIERSVHRCVTFRQQAEESHTPTLAKSSLMGRVSASH
eukprot:SAG31_NODE_41473_length_276_cov_0.576271_1_plen_50_part_10